MLAFSGHPAAASPLPGWTLLFARETEQDLDFEEDLEDLEEGHTPGGYTPKSPQKDSGRRPLLWVLLLVLVGAGGYLAMEPEVAMELIGPLIGEEPPPPVIVKPPPKPRATVPPAPAGTAPKPAAQPKPTPAPQAVAAVPSPQFMEGQRVSVILDPAAPGGSLSLSADPAGTRPGPKVSPGAPLTVLDGALHNNSWVYSVRTKDGAIGWIAEARLVPKP